MTTKPPILVAVRGLEHPEDYYQTFEHSTHGEILALCQDHDALHELNKHENELKSKKSR
jgi:hypothetical protein